MAALVKTSGEALAQYSAEYSEEEMRLIKNTLMPQGASDDELKLFARICKHRNLDPFAKQIYAVERFTDGRRQIIHQTSIDGFRSIAARTGEYEGQTMVEWCDSSGRWSTAWLSSDPPVAARVGVYRRGFREPAYGFARFEAYAQRKKDGRMTHMWAKMPDNQIAKCAEALALRKAFPENLSGIYTDDEMAQADNDQRPQANDKPKFNPVNAAKPVNTVNVVNAEFVPVPVQPSIAERFEKFVTWFAGYGYSREDLHAIVDCSDEAQLTEEHMSKLRESANSIKEQRAAEEKFKADRAAAIVDKIMNENDDDVKF